MFLRGKTNGSNSKEFGAASPLPVRNGIACLTNVASANLIDIGSSSRGHSVRRQNPTTRQVSLGLMASTELSEVISALAEGSTPAAPKNGGKPGCHRS